MKEKKRSVFTFANLVTALLCFAFFMVAGLWLYYAKVPYLTLRVWTLCGILAAVGAAALFFHCYHFAALYYIGCVLGWFAGQLVGRLEGDEFTSRVWRGVTFAVITVFLILGLLLQMKAFKRRYDRRKAEKAAARVAQAETEKLENQLLEARKEKAAAQAALEAVFGAGRTSGATEETAVRESAGAGTESEDSGGSLNPQMGRTDEE